MIRTQIQLSESQAAFVKEVAAEEGKSMAEVIRTAIELLREQRQKPSRRELMLRSLEAIGKYHAGVSDLAENHDAYLAEGEGTW